MALAPCPSCARHVRMIESECPFCAATLASSDARVVPLPVGATRARIFLGAVTLAAAAATGCSKPVGGTTSTATSEPTHAIAQPYGVPVPPPDAGVAPTNEAGSVVRPVSPSGAYGAPPNR